MKIKSFIPALLAALVFGGCKEDFFEATVDVKVPDHTPVLSLTSEMLAGDSAIFVYVTHTLGILVNGEPKEITDATVEVRKNGQPFAVLPYQADGFYTATLPTPLSGEQATYVVRASSPEFGEASAEQTMPAAVQILTLDYTPEGAIDEYGDRLDEIEVEFQDPAGEENYYMVEMYITDSINNYSYKEYPTDLDPLAQNFDGDRAYLKDATIDGKKYKWRFGLYPYWDDNNGGAGVSLEVHFYTVTRDHYLFARSASQSEEADDNPFAEPVIVHNNIEGGYGIFSMGAKDVGVIRP